MNTAVGQMFVCYIDNCNMALRLSEQTSIFGGVFFVSKFLANLAAKEA